MVGTYQSPPPPVSKETHCIAGILTTVYGLSALHADIQNVACLWLLQPRLQTQECMEPIASSTIHEWNEKVRRRKNKDGPTGLIAVSFDQRNHGSREVNSLANETWKAGNERHAQDMFASYRKPHISIYKSVPLISYPHDRWNRHRHLPPPNLHLILHLPHHNANHNHQHSPRRKSWRPRSLALHNARPSHNHRNHNNRMSGLHPPYDRSCTAL